MKYLNQYVAPAPPAPRQMLQVADAPASVSGVPFGAVHIYALHLPVSYLHLLPAQPRDRGRCWDVILPVGCLDGTVVAHKGASQGVP